MKWIAIKAIAPLSRASCFWRPIHKRIHPHIHDRMHALLDRLCGAMPPLGVITPNGCGSRLGARSQLRFCLCVPCLCLSSHTHAHTHTHTHAQAGLTCRLCPLYMPSRFMRAQAQCLHQLSA